MTITLFDQEYAMKAFAHETKEEGREEGRQEGKIQATIEMCQEDGYTYDETVMRISKKYSLNHDEADRYMSNYWQEA